MTDNNDEKPNFFVSRRGRQIGVHEVDLGGIDIDSEKSQPKSAEPKKQPDTTKPAKPAKAPRNRRSWSRKQKIIIAAVVAVVLLLPAAIGELVVSTYNGGVTSAKKELASLVSSTVLPAQKKTSISADQIRTIADKVNDIVGHICRGGLIDNTAQLYPRANSALKNCKTVQSQHAALVSNLYALETQARYLERVDALIKPVATPITDEYAVIGAQQSAWQNVADGISKLTPPDAMKSAHTDLVTHVTAVATAWSKLNTANNSQDAAGFEQAEKTLAIEYEAVRQTSPQFNAVLADTQAKVTANYAGLK